MTTRWRIILALALIFAAMLAALLSSNPFTPPAVVDLANYDSGHTLPATTRTLDGEQHLGRRERRAKVQASRSTDQALSPDTANQQRQVSVEDLLLSSQVVDREEGYRRVREMTKEQPKPLSLGLVKWLGPMLQDRRLDDIEDAAVVAITYRPQDTESVCVLQWGRVEALVRAQKPDEALRQIKSYFNVIPVSDVKRVDGLLSKLVTNAPAWAAQHGIMESATPGAATTSGREIYLSASVFKSLRGVSVDDSAYKPAIAAMSRNLANYNDRLALANLLLLADRPQEAKETFFSMLSLADLDKPKLYVILEGLARATKALTGDFAKADELIAQLRRNDWAAAPRIKESAFASRNTAAVAKKIAFSSGRPSAEALYLAAARERVMPASNELRGVAVSAEKAAATNATGTTSRAAPKFVTAMATGAHGALWAAAEDDGSGNGGVWFRSGDDQTWRQYTTKDGLGEDDAYAIDCDSDGRVWVGHRSRGLSVFDGEKWQTYEVLRGLNQSSSLAGPLGERVFEITSNHRDRSVWIATSAGISRYDTNNEAWSYFGRLDGLPEDQVNAFAFDRANRVYIGTQCHGLYVGTTVGDRLNVAEVRYCDSKPTEAQPELQINDIAIGASDEMAVATNGGVFYSDVGLGNWRHIGGIAISTSGTYGNGEVKPTFSHTLLENKCSAVKYSGPRELFVGHFNAPIEHIDLATGQLRRIGPNVWATCIVSPEVKVAGLYGHGVLNLVETPKTEPAVTDIVRTKPKMPAEARSALLLRLNEQPRGTVGTRSQERKATIPPVEHNAVVNHRRPVYVGEDWRTQGDWVGRYGRRLAVLAGAGWPFDHYIAPGGTDFQVTVSLEKNWRDGDSVRRWLGSPTTSSRQALYDPKIGRRIQAEWDDHGEAYSPQTNGPNLSIDVVVPAGKFLVSLYFANDDAHRADCATRDYIISATTKESAATAAAEPRAYSRLSFFRGGVYKQFAVEGPGTYRFIVSRNGSLNAICSGLFIDDLLDNSVTSTDPLPWMGSVQLSPPVSTLSDRSQDASERERNWNRASAEVVSSPDLCWRLRTGIMREVDRNTKEGAIQLAAWRWSARIWGDGDVEAFNMATATARNELGNELLPPPVKKR